MSARLSFFAFPTLHGHARSSLHLSRDICCGMVKAKERGYWRRHPNISLGFLFFPPCPWLVLSFPGGSWAGDSPKGVFSAEGLSGMAWLFLLRATWGTSQEAELYFYLMQALWHEKWTFALHVCDAVLLNCFLSKVHISQCGTFLANQKTMNKYAWIKGSMLIIQTICQVVCLTSVL